MTTKKLKIAYLSGPCNGPATYTEWVNSSAAHYFGSNYMKQFFQMASELDADCYVITTHDSSAQRVQCGRFIFDNRPRTPGLRGVRFHLQFIPWFAFAAPPILRFKPDVLITTDNAPYWFLWSFMWLVFRIPTVPSFHAVLWPKYQPRTSHVRLLWQLNRWLALRYMKIMLVTADDITLQIEHLLGRRASHRVRFVRHFPTYPPSQFAAIPAPRVESFTQFRILFAGRIEVNKGVYDLLEIARRLDVRRPGVFQFDICGDGSELASLRAQAESMANVSVHGYCDAAKLTEIIGQCHAWIVPTKSTFAAGYEMVCAEAILACRPLITSSVCPALEDVREASIEVAPDDIESYCAAILKLWDDKAYYWSKQEACVYLHGVFYNKELSWGAKMKLILNQLAITRASPVSSAWDPNSINVKDDAGGN
jgi:glycogen synthase